MLSRRIILSVSGLRAVRRMVHTRPVYRRLVLRFVAGEDLGSAVSAARSLHGQGMRASLDYLGEKVTDRDLARSVVEEYRRALTEGLAALPDLDATLSVKPSQLGIDLDLALCRDNLRSLLDAARAAGGRMVRIDMEDSTYVDRTLAVYEQLREEGWDNVGVVLQAYLRRTPEDLARLARWSPSIRLCKGAYSEPKEIAYSTMAEIRRSFLDLSRELLAGPYRPAFATHDPVLIARLRELTRELALEPPGVEFQMLYGIRRELQTRLASLGYGMRVYVPYGREWYAYFSRRIAERPENLWFFARNLMRR